MKRAKVEWAWREDALRLERRGFPPFHKRPRVLVDTTAEVNGYQVPVQLVRYSRRSDAI